MRNDHSNPERSQFDNTTRKLDTLFSVKIIILNRIKKDREENLKL